MKRKENMRHNTLKYFFMRIRCAMEMLNGNVKNNSQLKGRKGEK